MALSLRILSIMGILSFLGLTAAAEPLNIGTAIPKITAPDETGSPVNLADASAGLTLVYFYPKADTPGCTVQACSLRDSYAELQERGVKIFGVSADSPEKQKAFKEKHQLPFTLIADSDQKVMNAFGVPNVMGLARRQAFLFKDGKLIWRDLAASTKKQAEDVLTVIKEQANAS